MINRFAVLSCCLLLTAAPVLAQTPAPAATPAAGATSSASPAAVTTPGGSTSATAPKLTKDGKPTMKSVREDCRAEVLAGGQTGEARKQAMADCIIKQRPDMEARIKCSMDPSLKGMAKDARRAAVKACVQKTKG